MSELMNGAMNESKKSVIVVGSGLAGLTAASQLISHSIPVHMLERFPKPGGNSIKASSGINGAPTRFQPGPPFSDTFFYADSVKSAGKVFEVKEWRKRREELIGVLVNDSAGAIKWLSGEKDVDLSVVAQLGGHSFPRTHRGAGSTPPGASLVFTLLNALKANPLFTLETGCVVTKVLKSEKGVEGVEYTCEDQEISSRMSHGPVIFASGGFGADSQGMLATYRPDLAGFPSTNTPRPGSQSLLTEVGAQLLDMDQVQVHPTSFVDPSNVSNPVKFLAAELIRGEGGLLLHKGKRFINEMETRKKVTDAITSLEAAETSPRQWDVQLVIDEGVYENASSHIDFYIYKKLMRKTTIAELYPSSSSSSLDAALADATLDTIKTYAISALAEHSDPFKRSYFGHWKLKDPKPESVVYVGRVTPAVHFTMGGVVIDEHARVMDGNGKAIKGLWAAGEVTGGVHGENRLGGSSLLECVVFGRRAGDGASAFLSED